MSSEAPSTLGVENFSIWGTSAAIAITDTALLPQARVILDTILTATNLAANRFDVDSEISQLNASGSIHASAWFLELLVEARRAYEISDGLCDPTVLSALMALGYDRDFDALSPNDEEVVVTSPSPGWSSITIDGSLVELSPGTTIDLGASAKAAAADAGATAIAAELACGVLVDLGGDLRIAGASPSNGWPIGLASSAKGGLANADISEVVALSVGAMASSSSVVRRWQRSDTTLHHIIDPSTGMSAKTPWSMASVVASTAVEANALSTAAIIWGEDAVFELGQRKVQARLVRHDGSIERVGGWVEPKGERP